MFLFILFSCATPFLKVKSEVSFESTPTLMTTVFMNTVDERDGSNPFDMLEREDIDEVGQRMITKSVQMLDKQGFQVYLDKEKTQRFSLITDDVEAIGTSRGFFGGVWYCDDASTTVIDNNTIFDEPLISQVISTLDTERENEYFLFISATLTEKENYFIKRKIHLLIDYVIVNEVGIVVFRARGIGEGEKSFLFADKSKKSLTLAIDNAIRSVEEQAKQEL